MKTEKIFGTVWLVVSFLYIYQGYSLLYQYSTPGVLWTFIIPISIAYAKIVFGIVCLLIGINFLKEKSKNDYLILLLIFLLILYFIVDIIQYGIESIYYHGENILLLILIITTFYKLKIEISITNLIENFKQNKIRTIGILVLACIPYILAELTTYNSYKFLH